ncbi:acetate--CoA ligase family protein [Candidatus Foliamicus sp.]
MEALFSPCSVAIVGASDGVTATGSPKLGAAAIGNLIKHKYKGKIYPVNPGSKSIAGLRCYSTVEEIRDEVDLAMILLPAESCLQAMRQCARAGIKAAIVFSSGFSETGNHQLESELSTTCRDAGMRFCGPNTAGLIGNTDSFVASISMVCALDEFKLGDIAFVTQSGALGGSMLGRGVESGVGFSHWVSTGNEADLQLHDYVNYLIDDDRVNVIALFIEGIRNAQGFIAACKRAAAVGKPIVAYKTGLSEVSAKATASHTGAIAGSDKVFNAVCKQFGIMRVTDAADLLSVARAFSWTGGKYPRSNRVAIISASGGICGVAADDCHRFNIEIPELTDEAKKKIGQFVPDFAAVTNPIDLTGQIRSSATGYQDTVRAVLEQDYIDGVLLLVTMASEPRATFYGEEISRIARESEKPVIVGWCGATSLASKGYPMLLENEVPTFLSAREAVQAFAHLYDYGQFRQRFLP